jgi:hypothetical protein
MPFSRRRPPPSPSTPTSIRQVHTRSVPWRDWQEWHQVATALASSDPQHRSLAAQHVAAWRCRGRLPAAIDATATLTELLQSPSLRCFCPHVHVHPVRVATLSHSSTAPMHCDSPSQWPSRAASTRLLMRNKWVLPPKLSHFSRIFIPPSQKPHPSRFNNTPCNSQLHRLFLHTAPVFHSDRSATTGRVAAAVSSLARRIHLPRCIGTPPPQTL